MYHQLKSKTEADKKNSKTLEELSFVFNRCIEDTSSAEDLQMLTAEGLRRKLSHSFVADTFQQIGDKIQVSHQSSQKTSDQDPM